jgi:hypothetical protein
MSYFSKLITGATFGVPLMYTQIHNRKRLRVNECNSEVAEQEVEALGKIFENEQQGTLDP